MSDGGRAIWQISGRAAGRSYDDAMLRYSVALVGPGDAGCWSPRRDDGEFDGGCVRRFASELAVGDVLLLRVGTSTIRAVGVVAGDYSHLDLFDDVNGLDLQHTRRVRWTALPQDYDFGEAVFGQMPSRFSRVQSADVRRYADAFLNSPPTGWQEAPLSPLPAEEPPLEEPPEPLVHVVSTARDLYPLFRDPDRFGSEPSEEELIAHFVIPLFRALGWPPELTAVEWRRIDVALFARLPRVADNCCLVVEAKRLSAGVDGALEQAQGYVATLGSPRDIVVTDGIRYRMYRGAPDDAAVAYANLARLKRSATALFDHVRR